MKLRLVWSYILPYLELLSTGQKFLYIFLAFLVYLERQKKQISSLTYITRQSGPLSQSPL